jgi:hypothetical protein
MVYLLLIQITKEAKNTMEGINIQLGKITINKTARFIKPCLRYYGEECVKKLSSVFKLAYGINDVNLNKEYNHHIFILVDTKKCTNKFIEVIEWVRTQEYYENDYAVDNLLHGRLHMIVIKLPDIIDLSLFLSGKYSQMYNDEEILDSLTDDDKAIIIKDENYKIKFVEKVNEYFKSNLKLEELKEEAELELPPNIDEKEFFY